MDCVPLSSMIQEIHDNAVAHGFWKEGINPPLLRALIHSEWSEALEEYRGGRPMIWYEREEAEGAAKPSCAPKDRGDFPNSEAQNSCPHRSRKPEGIAVELLDGVIRILDWMGAENMSIESINDDLCQRYAQRFTLPELIDYLHTDTSEFPDAFIMSFSIALVIRWLEVQAVDWWRLLKEKHEYNKSRPYLHGKKC